MCRIHQQDWHSSRVAVQTGLFPERYRTPSPRSYSFAPLLVRRWSLPAPAPTHHHSEECRGTSLAKSDNKTEFRLQHNVCLGKQANVHSWVGVKLTSWFANLMSRENRAASQSQPSLTSIPLANFSKEEKWLVGKWYAKVKWSCFLWGSTWTSVEKNDKIYSFFKTF